MKRSFWIFVLLICSLQSFAQGFSSADVKDPKKDCASCYVANPDGILSSATVQRLNAQLDSLHKATTAQVAVVAVLADESTSARDLSMELFDKWKIGEKGSDNGLLVLLCVNSRDVFLRTGYGLEGALPDAALTRIFNEKMAPHFRRGDWNEGISEGVDAAVGILYEEYATNGFAKKEPISYAPFIYAYSIVCLVYLFLAILVLELRISKLPSGHKTERISVLRKQSLPWLVCSIVFLFSMPLFVIWVYFIRPYAIRTKALRCTCGGKMRRLSESEEDEYLSAARQLEETLGSRDYDVWKCGKCNSVVVYAYDKVFSGYSECPNCKAKTYKRQYDTVVYPATTLREGLAKTVYECKNCGHRGEKLTAIPKKPPVVVVGGIGGSGSGGGLPGGGSWGGGMSGGGGGGGRF